MAIVKCKPTSAGRRFVVKVVNQELHKGAPYAPLLEKKSKTGGRNNNGRITTRHIGGGHKQHYRLVVVEDFAVDAPKTKALASKLNGMGLSDVLIVSDAVDQNLYPAARNLPHVDVRDAQGSDPVSLTAYDKVLITVSAVKKFEELLG